MGPWPETKIRSPYFIPGEKGRFRGAGPALTASFLINIIEAEETHVSL